MEQQGYCRSHASCKPHTVASVPSCRTRRYRFCLQPIQVWDANDGAKIHDVLAMAWAHPEVIWSPVIGGSPYNFITGRQANAGPWTWLAGGFQA